jgi:hypothetical protein
MKLLRISAVVVFSLFMFSSVYAFSFTNPSDDESVKVVIEDYSKGIDNRNTEALEKVIYPGAHFLNFNKVTNKITEISNDELIELIKKGKAGGWERELNISSVDINGNTAVAKVEMTDAKIKQAGFVTLVKENGSWKIMSGAYTLETLK